MWPCFAKVFFVFPDYYEREQVWSSDSLERRKSLLPLIEAHQASMRAGRTAS
jgi:hypothetical protein